MTEKIKAKRFNTGKVGLSITMIDTILPIYNYRRSTIPTLALYELAKVSQFGAAKYDDFADKNMTVVDTPNNWMRTAMPFYVPFDCMDRHFSKFDLGETRDLDSGAHHLAHAVWNQLATVHYIESHGGDEDFSKFEHGTIVHERYIDMKNRRSPRNLAEVWDRAVVDMLTAARNLDETALYGVIRATMCILNRELCSAGDRMSVFTETERTAEFKARRIAAGTQNLKGSSDHADK